MAEEQHVAREITAEEFEPLISQGVAVVDFWAPWCGPCHALAPRIEELAQKYKDNPAVKVVKLNVDEAEEISGKYGILSIPTVIIFDHGEPSEFSPGVVPTEVLVKKVEQVLSKQTAAAK